MWNFEVLWFNFRNIGLQIVVLGLEIISKVKFWRFGFSKVSNSKISFAKIFPNEILPFNILFYLRLICKNIQKWNFAASRQS
jgi:hypothetical protein